MGSGEEGARRVAGKGRKWSERGTKGWNGHRDGAGALLRLHASPDHLLGVGDHAREDGCHEQAECTRGDPREGEVAECQGGEEGAQGGEC